MYQTIIGGRELIKNAGELIRKGEIVAFPTETVYGLGGNALDESAINKIYEAKNRPKDNPFIVHVTDAEAADKVAVVTQEAEKLFKIFSPGPITVVLRKRDCIPYAATAGLGTVGVRIPSHPMCREFLKECKVPVAAPSANLSKRVSPTSASHVYEDMNGRIPLILDGGDSEVGIESTVISLAAEVPTVLRPGIITIEKLVEVFPEVRNHKGEIKVAPSPGMKYTHYAPLVPCVMFDSILAAAKAYDNFVAENLKPVILIKGSWEGLGEREVINMGADGKEIAKNIFGLLRYCEKNYDRIIVEKLSDCGEEGSVMNRLVKSCGGKILP